MAYYTSFGVDAPPQCRGGWGATQRGAGHRLPHVGSGTAWLEPLAEPLADG